jgi:hypothetical protein
MTKWEVGQKLYRAEWWELHPDNGGIQHYVYEVQRLTPKGAWLTPSCRSKRQYGLDDLWRSFQTRWASTTKEEALSHLRARARSHLKHSRRRWEQVNRKVHALYDGLEFCPCAECFTPPPRFGPRQGCILDTTEPWM